MPADAFCCGACAHGAAVESGAAVAPMPGAPLRFLLDAEGAPIDAVLLVDGRPVPLRKPSIVIGRSHQSDVVISSQKLSKRAVAIRFCADGAAIEDLGSTCGVWVNGQRLGRGGRPLHEGDRFYLADSVCSLIHG